MCFVIVFFFFWDVIQMEAGAMSDMRWGAEGRRTGLDPGGVGGPQEPLTPGLDNVLIFPVVEWSGK